MYIDYNKMDRSVRVCIECMKKYVWGSVSCNGGINIGGIDCLCMGSMNKEVMCKLMGKFIELCIELE